MYMFSKRMHEAVYNAQRDAYYVEMPRGPLWVDGFEVRRHTTNARSFIARLLELELKAYPITADEIQVEAVEHYVDMCSV